MLIALDSCLESVSWIYRAPSPEVFQFGPALRGCNTPPVPLHFIEEQVQQVGHDILAHQPRQNGLVNQLQHLGKLAAIGSLQRVPRELSFERRDRVIGEEQ